jgi:hypothetical protein
MADVCSKDVDSNCKHVALEGFKLTLFNHELRIVQTETEIESESISIGN